MRRNIVAALALVLCGALPTATAIAQQPIKVGVLNDQPAFSRIYQGIGSVIAAQHGGRGFWRQGAGPPSRSFRPTTRTSRTSAPPSRAAGSTGERRGDRRPAELRGRARRQRGDAERNKVVHRFGAGLVGSHRQGLLAASSCTGPTTPMRWPRRSAAALVEQGGENWFFITADYAFGHALERRPPRREEARRQGAGRGAPPDRQQRLLVLPAAGAGLGGEDRRRRQRGRRHHQHDQAGRANSASTARGRSSSASSSA